MNGRAKHLYAGCYWGARHESAEECARRTVSCLQWLAQVHPAFSHWYQQGRTRVEALKRPLLLEQPNIVDLVRVGRSRRDSDHAVVEELGFQFALWTGGKDDESAVLRVRCGSRSEAVRNNCILLLPERMPPGSESIDLPMLQTIADLEARAWEPEWGVIAPEVYPQFMEDSRPGGFAGWLTFIRASPDLVPTLPSPATCIRLGKGTLIIATQEPFNAHNPLHLDIGRRLTRILREAGLLTPLGRQFDDIP